MATPIVTKPEIEAITGNRNGDLQLRVTNLGIKVKSRKDLSPLNKAQAIERIRLHSFEEAKDANAKDLWDWTFKEKTLFRYRDKKTDSGNKEVQFEEARITNVQPNKIHFEVRERTESGDYWVPQSLTPAQFVNAIDGELISVQYLKKYNVWKKGDIYGKINRENVIMPDDKKLEIVGNAENQAKFSYENYYDNGYYEDEFDLQQQSNLFMDNVGHDIDLNGGYNQQQQLLSPQIILPVQYGMNDGQNVINNGDYVSQEWLAVVLPILLIGACLFGMICVILMGFGGLFCYRQGQEAGGEDEGDVIYRSLPRKPCDGDKGDGGLIRYDEDV